MQQAKSYALSQPVSRARAVVDVSPLSRDNPFRRQRMQQLKSLVDAVIGEKGACKLVDIGGKTGTAQVVGIRPWMNEENTPKKFKDCFSTHATYGEKTLKECMQLSSDSGTDGLVKHLCAAYLNHASGKTPGEICSTQTAQSIWSSHNSKGYWEPTAGVRWYADSCT